MEVDEGVPLKRAKKVAADPERCIICQTVRNKPCAATPDGREKVVHAAEVRQDQVVLERINQVGIETFTYHTDNECYKHYTRKDKLEKIERDRLKGKESELTEPSTSETSDTKPAEYVKTTRSKVSPRPAPQGASTGKSSVYLKNCVVCGQKSIKTGINSVFLRTLEQITS